MHFYDKISIVLMVQGTFDLFCYFSISPEAIYGFEEKYGVGTWSSSRQIIKVKKMVDGNGIEIKRKEIDKFETSSFIKLNDEDIDVYVEYGRELFGNEFVPMAISNVVSTPRASKSKESNIYFVDFKNKNVSELTEKETSSEGITNENSKNCVELNKIIRNKNYTVDKNDTNLPLAFTINNDLPSSINVDELSKYEYIPASGELSTSSNNFNKDKANNEKDKRFFEKYFREIEGKYKTSSSK